MAAKSLRRSVVPATPMAVPFQFPVLKSEPPEGPDWLYEFKLDGYRLQGRISGGRATFTTRRGHDYTDRFHALCAFAEELGDCILDGEIVALGDHGLPDFSALESAIASRDTDHLVYFVFDCLYAGGEDMRPYPLSVRKHKLRSLLEEPGEHLSDMIRYVEPVPGPGKSLIKAARALAIEGLVCKRLDAPYVAGKPDTWRKVKIRPAHDVIVGGWRQNGPSLASLYVGVPAPGGGLRYIGQVGTGFSGTSLRLLMPALKSAEATASPFETPDAIKDGGARWVRPEIVVEVEIAEVNARGKLRQASFKRLRPDKSPNDVSIADLPGVE